MGVDLLRLSLVGGLLGLDGTSVGQFMLSRPLVSGALAGWAVGDPATGILVGALLELYLIVAFPTGGAAFPEGTTATVVAVGTATSFDLAGGVPVGLALGLVWGQVAGSTITWHRKGVTRLVPTPEDPVGARALGRTLAVAIGLDFLRGVVVTGAGLAVGLVALGPWVAAWPLAPEATTGLLLVGGAVSAGILLNDLGGARARGAWLLLGVVAGAARAWLV